MSEHAEAGLDEAAHKAEVDMSSGVVDEVVGRRSRHTSVKLSQVAADIADIESVVVADSDLWALLQEKCSGAVPQAHLPAFSSRPSSCSADARGSLLQQSRDLRRSSRDVNVLFRTKGRSTKAQGTAKVNCVKSVSVCRRERRTEAIIDIILAQPLL
jgi:hypothetical protein